ncbi:MAG: hypothetical protein ABEH38_09980 [Flavobacteriales bacterium]
MIEGCKRELPPYTYSNSRSIMTDESAEGEISVSLMEGEQYRLVFNIAHIPKDAVIKIYEDPKKKEDRDLLKTTEDIPSSHRRFIYEPPSKDGGDIYVSYRIPDIDQKACFSFVVGYKLGFLND